MHQPHGTNRRMQQLRTMRKHNNTNTLAIGDREMSLVSQLQGPRASALSSSLELTCRLSSIAILVALFLRPCRSRKARAHSGQEGRHSRQMEEDRPCSLQPTSQTETARQSEHELLRQSDVLASVTRVKLLHALLCTPTRA